MTEELVTSVGLRLEHACPKKKKKKRACVKGGNTILTVEEVL